MSMILDALRKMEQERKAGNRGTLDIRPEVVCYTGRPQKQRRNRHVYTVGAIALLLAVLLAIFFLKKAAPIQENRTAAAVPTALPGPAAAPSQPSGTAQQVTENPLPRISGTKGNRQSTPGGQFKTGPTAASSPSEARDLAISGIAWQDERRLRRAVVNGELVSEGSEIAGSRVVLIREDRIRFSRNGRTFDVPYASAFTR